MIAKKILDKDLRGTKVMHCYVLKLLSKHPVVLPKSSCDIHLLRSLWLRQSTGEGHQDFPFEYASKKWLGRGFINGHEQPLFFTVD